MGKVTINDKKIEISSFGRFVKDASEHGGISVSVVNKLPLSKRAEPFTLYMVPQADSIYYDCYGLVEGRLVVLETDMTECNDQEAEDKDNALVISTE